MTISISPQPIASTSYSTSPLRSSPLSGPPLLAADLKRRVSANSNGVPIPRRASHSSNGVLSNPSPFTPSPLNTSPAIPSTPSSTNASGLQPSPTLSGSPSSPTASARLLGSYSVSLVHARLGQPHTTPTFALHLRAIATRPCCGPRAPTPLTIPFSATYYDLSEGSHTPWVADVDVESHFFGTYDGAHRSVTAPSSSPKNSVAEPPLFPGYRVPEAGQLQIIVKTPSPVHAFIVPYDLSTLEPGGRLLARERTYLGHEEATTPASPSSPSRKESLRYSVQLQFICVDGAEKEYYVARSIKLVFMNRRPEADAVLRTERADEVVPPPSPSASPTSVRLSYGQGGAQTSPGSRRRRSSFEATAEWSHVRSKFLARARIARGFDIPEERPASPPPVERTRSLLSVLAPEGRARSQERNEERHGRKEEERILDEGPGEGRSGGVKESATLRKEASRDRSATRPPRRAVTPSVRDPSEHRRRGSKAERELSEQMRALGV